MDLDAPVTCGVCGANFGSWRAVETGRAQSADRSEGAARRPRSDLRSSGRLRALLSARIVFNNRSTTVECAVRDISETGARIALSPHVTIPNEFDLEMPQKGRRLRAKVVWRDVEGCGVQFL
jgi:hypothetical protein